MDRTALDRAVPLVYGLLVGLSALLFDDAVAAVAIGGALLLALYYVLVRPRLVVPSRPGRARDRARTRG